MSRMTELTCPSGLRLKMRGLKGKDLDGLRDKRRVASGESLSELLNDCTIEVADRAIYAGAEKFDWADALLGDRMHAIVGLRSATNGDEYDFRIRCSDAGCRQMIDWTVDLKDLPVKLLPEASKETFLNGNRFETTAMDKRVIFKLTTGRDQASLARKVAQIRQASKSKQGEHERWLLAVAERIVEVDGVDRVLDWLEDGDLLDIRKLVKDMDAADCGVETGIEIACMGARGCGLEQEVNLPLDSTFFAPDL